MTADMNKTVTLIAIGGDCGPTGMSNKASTITCTLQNALLDAGYVEMANM